MLPALAIILVFSITGGLTDAHLLKVVSETHVKNTPNTLLPGDLRSNEMKSIQTESLQAETSHDGIKSVGVGGVRYSASQQSTSSAMFAHDRNQGPTRGKRNNSRLNESGAHASRHKRQASDVACGGTLVGSGTIRSPHFPGNYQNNLNCYWTLQASSPATLLLLQIRRFSTEASYDILRISNTSGLQISLSGELQPRNVTITSPATISFTTDGSVLRTGFEIAFSTMTSDTACGGMLVGSGTIRSPHFPGNYQNNLNCHWTLQASSPATLLLLQVRRFSTEANYDILRISNTSGLQISLSGELQPRIVTIGSPANISFTTDSSVYGTGFEIAFITMTSDSCGIGWTAKGRLCYKVTVELSWNDARQACNSANGFLTDISSSSQENDIYDFLNTIGVERAWIGGKYQGFEDRYRWDSGRGATYINLSPKVIYDSLDEVCVEISTQSKSGWNANNCSASSRGVCQKLNSCGIGWTGKSGLCYKVTEQLTWNDARQACNSVNGFLVDISSRSQENDIYDFFSSIGVKRAWIGLNDQQNEGRYQWDSGRAVRYLNWANGEPNDRSGNDDCVSIFAEDKRGWKDNSCYDFLYGVCQKWDSCGGYVYGPSEISSSGGVNCQWTVEASKANNSILITFKSFLLDDCCDKIIVSDDSEFQYTLSGNKTPYDLLLRSPVKITLLSIRSDQNNVVGGFILNVTEVPGKAPRICRSGPWAMYGEMCVATLWYAAEMSWVNARDTCRAMGGLLVELDDSDKVNSVVEFLEFHADQTEEVWIGLKRGQAQSQWQWVSGRPMIYSSWAADEPRDVGSNASCVALTRHDAGGYWISDDCNALRTPMCTLLPRNDDLLR